MKNSNKRNLLFSNLLLKKLIAILVLSVYTIVHLGADLKAAQIINTNIKIDMSALNLAKNIGKITDRYDGFGDEKMYLINDLHCSADVQKNIEKILEEIKNKHGKKFGIIGLEGTPSSEIKTEIINEIKDEKVRNNIVEYYVDEGVINGAELFTIKNSKYVKLFGIEDKDIYLQNFSQMNKSLYYKYKLKDVLENLNIEYENLKKYFYTEEVKNIDRIKKSYEEGKIRIGKYIEYLKIEAKKENIDFDLEYLDLNKMLILSKERENLEGKKYLIEAELSALLKNLTKYFDEKDKVEELKNNKKNEEYYLNLKNILKGKNFNIEKNYKKLSKYLNFLEKEKEIDELKILRKLDNFRNKVIDKKLKTRGDAYLFFENYENLNLMKKYLNNEAGYNTVEKYQSIKNNLEKLIEFNNRIMRKNYLEGKNIYELKTAKKNMQEFYHLASKRNEIMANNILSKKYKKIKVKALIFGGYHSLGIKEYLKTRGISYEEIIPNIEENYSKNKMVEKLIIFFKYFDDTHISNLEEFCATNNDEETYSRLPVCISRFGEDFIQKFAKVSTTLARDEIKSFYIFVNYFHIAIEQEFYNILNTISRDISVNNFKKIIALTNLFKDDFGFFIVGFF